MDVISSGELSDSRPPLDTVLLHELNHRINNILQLAISALESAARRERGSTLLRAVGEMQAHATIFRLLGEAPWSELVDGGTLLAALCRAIQDGLPPGRGIRIKVSTDAVIMPAEKGRLLALLVHELVLNAAKHAFGRDGGSVTVGLVESDGEIRCSVTDTGLGLSNADPRRRGLGMTLVDQLARHAGAVCIWHIGQRGTEATIVMQSEPDGGGVPEVWSQREETGSAALNFLQRFTRVRSRGDAG